MSEFGAITRYRHPPLHVTIEHMFDLPPVTRALIVANVVIFLLEILFPRAFIEAFALWPIGSNFAPWQLLTYAFLHAGVFHLLFNMFAVFLFGSDLERVWGGRRYLLFYIVCALSAALMQQIVTSSSAARSPTLGASGAVFGLLLGYARYFPNRQLMLLFPPIPMKARTFVILYGLLELVLGVTGTQQGVAHFAHLGGLIGGFLLLRYWGAWQR